MAILDVLFAAIPLVGVLIFVHEFGHFIVAKMCGVRVLKFSIGFGPPIGFGDHRLRWERNGTEYVVAWFPLGGFVRMLGEQLPGDESVAMPIPEDARPEEFLDSKSTWQKLAIYFAGPGMNFVLPVLLFVVLLWNGIPRPLSVVGSVTPDSAAAEAGLRPGDRITAVDGRAVQWWDQTASLISARTAGKVLIEYERDGQSRVVEVPATARPGENAFGQSTQLGSVGIWHNRPLSMIGIPGADAAAAEAGLKSGDLVLSVAGEDVDSWEELRVAYEGAGASGDPVVFRVGRGPDPSALEELDVEVPALGDLEALGVVTAHVLVTMIQPGTPAEEAGLEPGDLVIELGGQPVENFIAFRDAIRASEGEPLELRYSRNGEVRTVALQARLVDAETGVADIQERVYQIGLQADNAIRLGAMGLERARDPRESVPLAIDKTLTKTGMMITGVVKLLRFELRSDSVRGPLTIFKLARGALDVGWAAYLNMMILISINLAVLNLLPIPVLDGGQILIIGIEGIKRAPLSLKSREFVTQVGFVMLVMIMGLAFWNDLSGQWKQFVQWLGNQG